MIIYCRCIQPPSLKVSLLVVRSGSSDPVQFKGAVLKQGPSLNVRMAFCKQLFSSQAYDS